MKINTYRTILEQMWQEDKKCFAPNAEIPSLCLRCGKPLNRRLVVNALSRYADVHICETAGWMKRCGTPAVRCSLCGSGMRSHVEGI